MLKNRLVYVSDSDLQQAMDFARANDGWVAPHHMLQKLVIFELVAQAVARSPHDRILEIGCGIGIHSALLTRFGEVSATELSAPGSFVGADRDVDEARERVFRALARGTVAFKYNDGRHLDYPDQTFDLVFHNSVIEHVPDVEAFNREVLRVLKPGGVCICITGTPTLCNYRLLRHWTITVPTQLLAITAQELLPRGVIRVVARLARRLGAPTAKVDKLLERTQHLTQRVDSVLDGAPRTSSPAVAIDVRPLYSRLYHFLYFPRYNRFVIENIAQSLGVTVAQLLEAVREHLDAIRNRIAFALCPRTHGQHYRDAAHERDEWRVAQWLHTFASSGFVVTQTYGYRYHHLLECTPSYRWDSYLYYLAVPLIRRRIERGIGLPTQASEIVIVARRPPDGAVADGSAIRPPFATDR